MINSNEGCRMFDHSNLYNKSLTIIKRKGFKLFLWPVSDENPSMGTFIANKENRDFFAEDPLQLLGMISIWEEHSDDWNREPKYPTEKIKNILKEEYYPESVIDYENFDEERFNLFVEKCQYFFKKDYMLDIEIGQNISRQELFDIMISLQHYREE